MTDIPIEKFVAVKSKIWGTESDFFGIGTNSKRHNETQECRELLRQHIALWFNNDKARGHAKLET